VVETVHTNNLGYYNENLESVDDDVKVVTSRCLLLFSLKY